jgi:hypothetical protein
VKLLFTIHTVKSILEGFKELSAREINGAGALVRASFYIMAVCSCRGPVTAEQQGIHITCCFSLSVLLLFVFGSFGVLKEAHNLGAASSAAGSVQFRVIHSGFLLEDSPVFSVITFFEFAGDLLWVFSLSEHTLHCKCLLKPHLSILKTHLSLLFLLSFLPGLTTLSKD